MALNDNFMEGLQGFGDLFYLSGNFANVTGVIGDLAFFTTLDTVGDKVNMVMMIMIMTTESKRAILKLMGQPQFIK